MGCKSHSLDADAFILRGAKGGLTSLLVLQVDDVLVAAGGEGADVAIDQPDKEFEWGRWRRN
eukprot:8294266-Prorocentrum_lima.AAC.1